MRKSEKMQYLNKKPVAVYGLSNVYGIAILDIIGGESVVYMYTCVGVDPTVKDIHIAKINYGVNKTTFRAGRLTIDLGECMRA